MPELINCLEKILSSPFHKKLKHWLASNVSIDFSTINEDIFLEKYYTLLNELKSTQKNLDLQMF